MKFITIKRGSEEHAISLSQVARFTYRKPNLSFIFNNEYPDITFSMTEEDYEAFKEQLKRNDIHIITFKTATELKGIDIDREEALKHGII